MPYEYEIYEETTYDDGDFSTSDGTNYCEYEKEVTKWYTFSRSQYNNYTSWFESLCSGETINSGFNGDDDTYYCEVDTDSDDETLETEEEECNDLNYYSIKEVYYDGGTVDEATKVCEYKLTFDEKIYFKKDDYGLDRDFYKGICNAYSSTIRNSSEDDELKWCYGSETYEYPTATAIQNGCESITTNFDCSAGYEGCSNSSTEMQLFAGKMADKLQKPDLEDHMDILSKNSNTGLTAKVEGTWTEDDDELDTEYWFPNERINYQAKFKLAKACIGLGQDDVTKAPITYITSGSCDENISMYGGRKYFVPLKWEDGVVFPVSIYVNDISLINLMDWEINETCGINTYQEIYGDPEYKFMYRPINMSDPFPGASRTIGKNWISFMDDYNANNLYAKNKLTRNQVEYSIDLTKEKIIEINGYNTYSYPNLNSIKSSGRSKALEDFGVTSLTGNYNELGKCSHTGDKKCWTS